MADQILSQNGARALPQLWKDLGDGSYALTVSVVGGGSGSTVDRELIVETYRANKNFTGASTGDLITATRMIDVSGAAPAQVGVTAWFNETTQASLSGAPLAADIDLAGGGGGVTNAEMTAIMASKATSALQTTGNASLASIATAAGAPADAAPANPAASGSIIAVLKGIWNFFTSSAGSAVDDLGLSNSYQTNRSVNYLYDTDTTFLSRFRGSKRGLWVEGGVAHAGTDSGNPVKVGGRYNSAATTLTNGQRSDALMNVDGALLVTLVGSSNTSDTVNNNQTQLFRSRTGTDVLPAFGNMYYDSNALAWVRARGSVARGALVDPRGTVAVTALQTAVSTIVAGSSTPAPAGRKTFQAFGTVSATTGSATINIEGSLDGTRWDVIGTFNLTLGTAAVSDSFTSDDRYAFVRSNVTAISGTSPSVTVNMGT